MRALATVLGGLSATLAWLAGGVVALCLAAVVALWWWSGSPQSLAQTLNWTAQWLAEDGATPPLTVEGATGSLRTGGTIAHLRWQRDGLTVEVEQLSLRWPASFWLDAALHRRGAVEQVTIAHLRVDDKRPPEPDTPRQPPADLSLPWLRELTIALDVQQTTWVADTPVVLGPTQARYRYGGRKDDTDTSPWHHLQVEALQWQDGRYQAQVELQAQQTMALRVQLNGELQPTIPSGPRLRLALNASLAGDLAPADATLQLLASVQSTNSQSSPERNGTPRLQAQAELRPWADMPLHQGRLSLAQIDLAAFWPTAPRTHLSGEWQATADTSWRLQGQLTNTLPGPWDQQRLPLERLNATLTATPERWTLEQLDATAAGGTLQATGEAGLRNGRPHAWQGELRLRGLEPDRLHRSLQMRTLDGDLSARTTTPPTNTAPITRFTANVQPAASTARRSAQWPGPELSAEGTWDGDSDWRFDHLNLQAWQTRLAAQGALSTAPWRYQGQAQLDAPGASITLSENNTTDLNVRLHDLDLFQRWSLQTVDELSRWLPGSTFAQNIPSVWRDVRWSGQTTLQAQLTGSTWTWQQQGQVQAQAEGVRWQAEHDAQAVGTWSAGRLDATLNTLALKLSNNRDPLGLTAQLQGRPALRMEPSGALSVQAGQLALTPWNAGHRKLPALSSQPLALAWDQVRWADGRLSTQGRLNHLALSWLNAWLSNDTSPQGPLHQAGLQGELLLQGEWDMDLPLTTPAGPARAPSAPPRARLSLQRAQGDLTVVLGDGPRADRLAAGIDQARVDVRLDNDRAQATLRWNSRNAGQAQAEVSTVLTLPTAPESGWSWAADAPLRGRLQADLPQLGLWSRLAPPGWRLSGRLQAETTLSGTRAQPEWQGSLQASQLTVRSLADGLDFSDGELRASVAGETLTIQSLQWRGAGGAAGGLLSGGGTASWAAREVDGQRVREPVIDLQLRAERLRLLARADRRLTLSGELNARLRGQRLDLTGRLDTDQALFLLPDESTPSLGSDVVVRGTERPPGFGAGSPVQAHVNVEFGLGNNFQVRGLGLNTYLGGSLRIAASPAQSGPQITGQVQTVRGSYQAYGQALNIEQGVVRFNGPVDNPSLDILALRPHPSQRVGVQIGGTAQIPRVRLYAEPDMPDSEKLAWLVLGRPATGAGAEAAVLQQAALALLSGSGSANDGSLTRSLGLDELSFQGESTATDGTTTSAALTLGKRISSQLYVSYSRSVTGAMGTVAVFYDISRFVTLRAQAGDDNAIDLLFTHSFDGRDVP